MKDFIAQNKLYLIIAGVVLVIGVVGFAMTAKKQAPPTPTTETAAEEEMDEPIPTVDASVGVELEAINSKREAQITVTNAPKGTESIDVEMSYETADKSLEGVIGEIKVKDGKGMDKFTLGTCSSGTCRYHDITSEIKLFLKFNGDYGEQIFEKSYKI